MTVIDHIRKESWERKGMHGSEQRGSVYSDHRSSANIRQKIRMNYPLIK